MFSDIGCLYWQVESGKLVLEKAEFDLEAELTALIDVFSVQCDNKGLFISLQLAGQIIFVPFIFFWSLLSVGLEF